MNNNQTGIDSSDKKELFIFISILGYFIFKGCYLAFNVNPNIFPDEITWFGICDIFSHSLLPPDNSPESYQFGLITHRPILYFYLMGKILFLNFLPLSDLVFLRLINVLLNTLTVVFAWKTLNLLVKEKAVQILCLLMLTNTAMFTFMSAAVNYDNLVNLLAILTLYYLLLFFLKRQSIHLLYFAFFLLAGGLTKVSFLPYAMLLLIVLLFHEWKYLFRIITNSKLSINEPHWEKILLSILCLLLFTGNLYLYIGNKIKFDRLEPKIDQVLTLDQALQFRLFARGYIAGKYRNGEITLQEAQGMAFQFIKHPGDRADTLDLLQRATLDKDNLLPRFNRFQYILPWSHLMTQRTFGIAAHKLLEKKLNYLFLYILIFILSGALFLWKINRNRMEGWAKYLLFIAGGYVLILMQLVNYKNYYVTGAIGSALTGRYLFLVIVPIYIIISHYLFQSTPRWWKTFVGLIVAMIFIYGDFPWFLIHATSDWFF